VKYSQLKAFEKHLSSAAPDHLAPVYAVIGKDPVLVKKGVGLLKDRVAASGFASASLEADRTSPEQLALELGSFSLFDSKRLVAVSNIDKAREGVKAALLKAVAELPGSVVLVLTGEALPANTKLYKAVEKGGVILSFPSSQKTWEKEREMEEWLLGRALESGKQLDPSAAKALIQYVGAEASALEQELEKLICYAGERSTIEPADISAVCRMVNQKTVWQLGEAIFHLKAAEAMAIAKALIRDQTPLVLLLRQIRKQMETDYQVCSLLAGNAPMEAITQQFPYMKGRILQLHIDNARRYGIERFKRGLIEVDRTELEAKNSGVDDECLLELLIARICR